MDSEIIKAHKKAGVIWSSAIKLAQKKAKADANLFELAESVENYIKEEGASPAFPINLSRNEEAAHFTPKWNDTITLKESDVLKIDVGVAVEGYICDGAITVNLDNKHAKQIEANTLALENAISVAKFGKPVERLGAEIERTLKEKGFNPVYNLGGHGLGRYDIHASPSIPNHKGGSGQLLEEGAIAIEPFATSGKGYVNEVQNVEIFSLEKTFGVRNTTARSLLKIIQGFEKMPFAERWLRREAQKLNLEEFQLTIGLKELMKTGCLHSYAGLRETNGHIVTQVEKSLIITESETIILGE
ncbi:MAG: type II methionyl aminopeptidase [archaeon]|jgi:methionyl aminopeptidase